MKKISLIVLMVLMLLVTVACDLMEPKTVTFKILKKNIVHVIGDDLPNYRSYFSVKTIDDKDITFNTLINDDEVDYETVGFYDVDLSVTYESVIYNETLNVEVIAKATGELPGDGDTDLPGDGNTDLPDDNDTSVKNLNIYYLNDLHGAVLEGENMIGLAKIANVILTEKTNNPKETLFLAGGDMLQGQIISNYYDGATVIDILNDMKLDAFVIGNHEFDWGIDKVLNYFNGTNELQANYPLLGANILTKENNSMLDSVKPYTIIEQNGLKIAVIGTIGYGLESSISFSRVEKYYFTRPQDSVKKYAKEARNLGADLVISVNHHEDDTFNSEVSKLRGEEKVDAIFNGHTHQYYVNQLDNNRLQAVQSGANGSRVGLISLSYDPVTKNVTSNAKNLSKSTDDRLNTNHPLIYDKVNLYNDQILPLYETIMTSEDDYSTRDIAQYIAKLMQMYTGADLAIHNFGGTRAPIARNENLSYSKLFQISPFDNMVVTVKVKGSVLNSLKSGNAYFQKSGVSIDSNKIYTVATNDYIYGGNDNLKNGTDFSIKISVLDLMVEVLEKQKENGYTKWNTDLPISFKTNINYQITYKKEEYFI